MKPIDAWRRDAKSLHAGGRRLSYWTSAETNDAKPWLLLIHGYPTSSWDWTFIWGSLTKHFRLVALDMLGFGLSEKPADIAYTISMQADFQEALLEHLGVGEAHCLAHDYGDTVAQELLARQNENLLSFRLKSIVFLNGGLFPEQHRARPIQKLGLTPIGFVLGMMLTRSRLRKTLDQIFGPQTQASDAEIDAHWAMLTAGGGKKVMHRLLRYIPERRKHRERWVGALVQSSIPLRLIDGGADPVSGAHLFEHYRKLVPDADAVLLESIGHYPQTEAPDLVARHFLEFHQRLRTISA